MAIGPFRTTHTWLKPLYAILGGAAVTPLSLGSPTSIIGLYGVTGIKQPTGLGASGGTTGGASGGIDVRSNGGTGTNYYSLSDLVLILKARGDIAR